MSKKCELCATKASIEDVSTILGFQIKFCPHCGKSLDQQTKTLEERRQDFIEAVRPFVTEENKAEVNRYCKYWLEKGPKARKYRFEKEATFDHKKRLNRWMINSKKFSIANTLRKR